MLISQIGELEIRGEGDKLVSLTLVSKRNSNNPSLISGSENVFTGWLISYFNGKERKQMNEVNFLIPFKGKTREILLELLRVGYGEIVTYGELAKRINTSPRVVGNAMSRNPLPIFIPCHRVVRVNDIGNYSLGGKETKKWLLEFEERNLKLKP